MQNSVYLNKGNIKLCTITRQILMKWATSCRSPVQNRSFPCDSSRQGNAAASASFNHSFWTEFFAVYNFCWILGMIFLAQNAKEKCPLIEATLTIVLCQKNQLFLDSVRLLSQKLILVTGLTLPLLWVQIKVFYGIVLSPLGHFYWLHGCYRACTAAVY